MTDSECKAIEQDCVEKVRKALKLITSSEIYDGRGYLNEKGYKALEELEGLDLFWVCDPKIKLVKDSDRWISVMERLPDKEGKCLVFTDYGDVSMDSFVDGMFVCNLGNVTHWKPLPKAPESEVENGTDN